jgi:hypothetical protein
MPAVVPQNCRVARVRCSRASHAPGPAGATRGPRLSAGLRAGLCVQGRERRRVAARRALVTRRPRRANELGHARRVVVPGFDPRFLAGGGTWGRRAVTRRRRRHRARLPGRRAVRRAREHGCERPNGRHTPVPSHDMGFSQRTMSRGEWHLNRAPAAHRAVAAPPGRFVEHLLGKRTSCAGLREEAGRRPGMGPKPS